MKTTPDQATEAQIMAMQFFIWLIVPCIRLPPFKWGATNLRPQGQDWWMKDHWELALGMILMEQHSHNPHRMLLRDRPRLRARYYSLCGKCREMQLAGGLPQRLAAWAETLKMDATKADSAWMAELMIAVSTGAH